MLGRAHAEVATKQVTKALSNTVERLWCVVDMVVLLIVVVVWLKSSP
jgi:hypothetical protein